MSEDVQLDGMRVCVSRTGYTGELGYEIYLHDATKNGTRLWNTVLEAGRPHGLEVIGPCHIRRIEGGILAFGADMWYDTNPFEVGMGYPWIVDLGQEAGFVGKQALRRIKAEGPRAQARRDRDRGAVGRHLHRQRDDRHVPGVPGRRAGR
jgi:aminomethyltransferase